MIGSTLSVRKAERPLGPPRLDVPRRVLTSVFLLHYTGPVSPTAISSPASRNEHMCNHGCKGGSMRSLSGARLALVAVLAVGTISSAVGCAKVGQLKSMKAFKEANQAYQQQDYKKAASLYEEAV